MVVAIGTVLGGERRWLYVLLVIATFFYLAGFAQLFVIFLPAVLVLAKLALTAFRSLSSLAAAATTNFEHCKQF